MQLVRITHKTLKYINAHSKSTMLYDCSEDKSILKDYINQPINDAFT